MSRTPLLIVAVLVALAAIICATDAQARIAEDTGTVVPTHHVYMPIVLGGGSAPDAPEQRPTDEVPHERLDPAPTATPAPVAPASEPEPEQGQCGPQCRARNEVHAGASVQAGEAQQNRQGQK